MRRDQAFEASFEEAWQWQREATAEQGNRIARVMMA
jgi:hypothetical protein